jgi:ZIP family zinc transporter
MAQLDKMPLSCNTNHILYFFMYAIFISLGSFIATLTGGLFAIKYREKLHYIASFSAGVLLGVCFFDIVPEIFEIATEHAIAITPALGMVVIGFLAIHILEKLAIIHSHHEDEYAEHKHPVVGLVGAGGLAAHSFLDGVGIGLAFHVSTEIGIAVSIAVIAHDFCDGLNTVTLMLVNRQTRKKALQLLAIDALAPILGAASTLLFTVPHWMLLLYLGFFVGFLLYISASDLLPEAHSKHSSFAMIALTALGALLMFVVTRFTV